MQVTRRRRTVDKEQFVVLGRSVSRRATLVTACVTALAVAATGTAFATTRQFGTEQVGDGVAGQQEDHLDEPESGFHGGA